MLSIYLTGELDLMKRSILVYYFFMAGDPRRDNATAMMRTLIWQLVNTAAEPQLVNHLSECMVSTVRSKQVMSEPETMWKMFTALVGALQQREVYCIIDGLDECISDDQDWIARKLIGNGPDGGLTILRTLGLSRPTLDLRSARHIDLDGAASPEIASDVRLYISTATTAIADRLDLSEAKRTMLEFDLAERAQGSFLWISFAISACARKGTYTRLMESLEKMPEGLFGIYRRILDDIEDDCKSDVVRVLQWVAMAKRPLHVRELAFLLRPTTTAFEEQIELTCDHIALCGPFLQLQEVEAHDWDTLFGNTRFQTLLQPVPRYRNRTQVNFVHDTVKEYLLNTAEHTGKKGASYVWQVEKVHVRLVEDCVTALSTGCRHCPTSSSGTLPMCQDDSCPMSSDAAYHWHYWLSHLQEAAEAASEVVTKMSFFTSNSSAAYSCWALWQSHADYYYPYLPPDMLPLHVAVCSDSMPWVRSLADTLCAHAEKPQAEPDQSIHTAIQHAYMCGNVKRIAYMLERGADANRDTIIVRASGAGVTHIVRLLLEHGADPNARTSSGETTAFHQASTHGHQEIMKHLLRCGADINVTCDSNDCCTPLHGAVQAAYWECDVDDFDRLGSIQLLLLHNPSLNIKNGRGHTAFDHAAWTNHKAAGLLVAARESEPTDLAERWERVRTAAVHAHLADYEVDLAHEAANPVIPTDEAPVIDWVEWMTQEMEDLNTTKQSLILRFGNSEDTGAKES